MVSEVTLAGSNDEKNGGIQSRWTVPLKCIFFLKKTIKFNFNFLVSFLSSQILGKKSIWPSQFSFNRRILIHHHICCTWIVLNYMLWLPPKKLVTSLVLAAGNVPIYFSLSITNIFTIFLLISRFVLFIFIIYVESKL